MGSDNGFFRGVLQAAPIVVGYMAFGIPFGILATKIGLPAHITILMSAVVYAGSAQFVALQLIVAGVGLFPIVAATFFLNLRHLLMSMSLGHHLPRLKPIRDIYLGHTITDEAFGINIGKVFGEEILSLSNVYGTNVAAHVSWILATVVGIYLGRSIPIEMKYLEGVLPIMFAALLALQLKRLKDWIYTVLAMGLMFVMMQAVSATWAFLVTAIVIPAVGTAISLQE